MASSNSMLPRKYLVEYLSREIWLSEAKAWLPSDGLKCYTDGSLCLRAGRVLEFFMASFALGTFATVFQAEVYAILACSDCLRECMTDKTICICSDSRAALLALSSRTVSSRLVLQWRNSLQGLSIHN
jgi:hypothetical protein